MDRQIIAAGIAVRRQQVTFIEDRLVTACERAAGRGRRGRRPLEDRDAWDRHTWNRYLREAVAQEHELGPELRRLHGEIAVLEQLTLHAETRPHTRPVPSWAERRRPRS